MSKSGWTEETKRAIARQSNPLTNSLRQFGGVGEIEVGIHKDAHDYDDTGADYSPGFISKVVFVGYIHEKGLTSNNNGAYKGWLTKAVLKDRAEYKRRIAALLKSAGKNMQRKKAGLEKLGKNIADKTRSNVDQNSIRLPANADATQWMKGGNTPMVDTSHLIQQIDSKVAARVK